MDGGEKAFQGKSHASLLTAILSADSPTMATTPAAPRWLERTVRRCLAKDPEARYQSMRDVVLDLQMPPVEAVSPGPPVRSRWHVWALSAAIVALAGSSVLLWSRADSVAGTADKPVRRFSFNLPTGAITPVISPDGSQFVFVQGSPPRLWVQALDQRHPRELEGTTGASKPFWSPDSRFIAFFASTQVRKVPAQGGPVTTITDDAFSPYERQGAWSPDGSQVAFTAQSPTKVYLAPAAGGRATLALDIQPGDGYFVDPLFLPGEAGRGKLIAVGVEASESTIFLQDLRTGRKERLATGTRPTYAASGHLIFSRDGIWALPLSPGTASPGGEPFPIVADGIDPSVANDGSLLYQDPGGGMKQVFWFDRSGRRRAAIGKPMRSINGPSLSRSERFVALTGGDAGNPDIWILDTVRATNSRLTMAPGVEASVAWTANDQEVIYWKTEEAAKGVDIVVQKTDGSQAARGLVVRPGYQYFMSSSPDGRFLFYAVETLPESHLTSHI